MRMLEAPVSHKGHSPRPRIRRLDRDDEIPPIDLFLTSFIRSGRTFPPPRTGSVYTRQSHAAELGNPSPSYIPPASFVSTRPSLQDLSLIFKIAAKRPGRVGRSPINQTIFLVYVTSPIVFHSFTSLLVHICLNRLVPSRGPQGARALLSLPLFDRSNSGVAPPSRIPVSALTSYRLYSAAIDRTHDVSSFLIIP